MCLEFYRSAKYLMISMRQREGETAQVLWKTKSFQLTKSENFAFGKLSYDIVNTP